jgi:hypothetical protein
VRATNQPLMPIAALALTGCLDFASQGLWHDLKGTFWISFFALGFAAFDAWNRWRSGRSVEPMSLRDVD